MTVRASADAVARRSYGKLVAILAARSGDIALAEDLLADAFRRALETWPERGVPDNPEAWLLTVARNRERDINKSAAARTRNDLHEPDGMYTPDDPSQIPDARLRMLFVCAHPAIAPEVRTPLMLQTVLGLDAEVVGSAFLVPKATMAQRLVRAKRKIKAARIAFAVPERADMKERLEGVLEAIYGAFATCWSDADLSSEALYLADLLVRLLPDEAEVLGLAAMLGFISSREDARRSPDGALIPLSKQDPARWNQARIDGADALLRRARSAGPIGRFQLEAAIQSVHSARRETGRTDWRSVVALYEGLVRLAPTIGAAVARAAAIGEAFGPQAGLAALAGIDPGALDSFQPAWAVKAHLFARAKDYGAAAKAYEQAIARSQSASERRLLRAANASLAAPSQSD